MQIGPIYLEPVPTIAAFIAIVLSLVILFRPRRKPYESEVDRAKRLALAAGLEHQVLFVPDNIDTVYDLRSMSAQMRQRHDAGRLVRRKGNDVVTARVEENEPFTGAKFYW